MGCVGKAVPTFGGLRREASAGRVESRRRQVKVEVIKRPSELGQRFGCFNLKAFLLRFWWQHYFSYEVNPFVR